MDTIKKLENTLPPKTILSNCFRKEHCPMRGACLTENVLNYTKICCDNEKDKPKSYKGICKTTFKKLKANHKKSFNEKKQERYKIIY